MSARRFPRMARLGSRARQRGSLVIPTTISLDSYGTLVQGISGLVAHWRCSDTGSLVDVGPNGLDGTWDSAPTLVGGLPSGSDQAAHITGQIATVAHDAALELEELTVSLWFNTPLIPSDVDPQLILFSKDATGFVNGDFVVAVEEAGQLYAQIQEAPSTAHRVDSTVLIEPNTSYHVAVTLGTDGLELWQDGRSMGIAPGYTLGWSENSRAVQLAKVGWQAELTNVDLDEVAVYSRMLTPAEIIGLSQRTAAPIAAPLSVDVAEQETAVLDVAAASTWVGRLEDLVVDLASPSATDGTPTVVGQTIEYEADDVAVDTDDSQGFTLTDANGTSVPATASISITAATTPTGNDDGRGGTLMFDFRVPASYVDNGAYELTSGTGGLTTVPIAARKNTAMDASNVATWAAGDSLAGANIISVDDDVHYNNADVCWNRAPKVASGAAAHANISFPAIEVWCKSTTGGGSVIYSQFIDMFPEFQGDPKHCRVAVIAKVCNAADSTTYKAQGSGPTSGAYPDFDDARTSSGGSVTGTGKFPCGMHLGGFSGQHSGCDANWWQGAPCRASAGVPSYCGSTNMHFNSNLASSRITFGSGTGHFTAYVYPFDRPGRCGTSLKSTGDRGLSSPGVKDAWFKLEYETQLTSEASCPTTCKFTDPPTAVSGGAGDGWVRAFLTKDIYGEIGTPGVREMFGEQTGLTFFCRQDTVVSGRNNLHKDTAPGAGICGVWLNWHFGGGQGAQAAVALWIKEIQLYVY